MVLKLSRQQLEVLKGVAQGKSVFITGSAGTGKSYILGFIVRFLRAQWGAERVYVTASTGLAACAVGGTTLHSFAGIGVNTDDNAETMAAKAFGKPECRDRWRHAKVLIIDEISMIDGDLFDKLEYVARAVREGAHCNNYKEDAQCFGGIQLIVTGDFFQLPPVKPPNFRKYFAFEADCWHRCFDLQIELKHPFRQCDERLIGMLNEIRVGSLSTQTLESLQACCRRGPTIDDDKSGIAPTRLYPLKVDVREENMKELRALRERVFKFVAQDSAASPVYRAMLESMKAQRELELCVGAQVLLVKNLDTEVGFVNGAKGVVAGFQSLPFKEGDVKEEEARLISPTMKWPVVRFACNRVEKIIGPEKQSLECGDVTAEPPSDEVHACFAAKDSMEKCLALPQCVWCLAMRKGNQCAHPHERIFKQNYEPKLKSHIDDMCASHTNAHEVLQKAKTAFDHSFQLTAGLDLKAVPSTRRFFGARLMVAVTTATFTYLYELSSGSSNANKLAIKGGQGSDIAITTAGFWLPVGGFGGSASDKCQLTSTVCDAAFLATGMLYKPQSDEQGSDPAAMEKLRHGGATPPHLKIKKEKKDKKAKPFSNHLLMPILERFSNIEQLQISIILSSFCETIFQGVTGLSQVCTDEWRGKCIGASNAWAVFRQHKRLAALPPTPKELVNAVDIAVKTPYHMTHSDVETMAIVNRLHHEKPIFGYAGNKFGDLAGALVGYKSCKVPDYVDHFLSKK